MYSYTDHECMGTVAEGVDDKDYIIVASGPEVTPQRRNDILRAYPNGK